MTEPTSKELEKLYPATLHTRWGRSGIQGHGALGDDFVCDCQLCFDVRLKRWRKVNAAG